MAGSELAHIREQIFLQDIDEMIDSLRTQSCQSVVKAAAKHHEIRAKGQRAQHIKACFDATVEDDWQRCHGTDRGQHVHCGRSRVKLAACVV